MTPLAWLFMLTAWAMILGCTLYCFIKLMTAKSLESNHDSDVEK